MKKRFAALTLVALTFLSCSSLNQLQKQTFNDGLYATSAVAQDSYVEVPAGEIDNLLAESKASPAYIIANGDTLKVAPGNSVVRASRGQVTHLNSHNQAVSSLSSFPTHSPCAPSCPPYTYFR